MIAVLVWYLTSCVGENCDWNDSVVPQSCVGEIVIAWSVSVVPESGVGKIVTGMIVLYLRVVWEKL